MPRLRVRDEHGPLRRALVHDPSNAIDVSMEELRRTIPSRVLREHPESGEVDREKVMQQHHEFREVLARHGVTFVAPARIEGAYCQIFTRDPCFVVDDQLFVGVMADDFRTLEVAGLGPIRNRYRARATDLIDADVRIEGGDVILIKAGATVLVGTNRNTNAQGVLALARHIEPGGARVVEVPHRALHLDCVLAPLPNGEALFMPERLPRESFERVRPLFKAMHPLHPHESHRKLAANLLWIDPETVVSSPGAPRTNRQLRDMGYRVVEVPFDDVVKKWGSFRCVVGPLERG
jgi:N-dimethylarginine dimethylaminohydrolase